MDEYILDLLADKNPSAARDFLLAWGEQRTASFIDAAHEARKRAATEGHRPHIRGQLRYHFGEQALRNAAQTARVGYIPLRTTPPGGIFGAARIGRFALISLMIPNRRRVPRRSVTRRLLSQPNRDIDPQGTISFGGTQSARGTTELSYLACLIASPCRNDPTIPSELVVAVPNAAMTGWIAWIPLHLAHAHIQTRIDASVVPTTTIESVELADKAFPKFRLPKRDEAADGDDKK